MSRSRRITYTSPCTSTSCRSSGLNSTRSPASTARTWLPTASASAHISRVATCAVDGMRMPPVERRSPSSRGTRTRTRSCSILIGSRPSAETTPADGTPRPPASRSAPAEFMKSLIVDAEVVCDLVYHRHRDFGDHVLLGLADGQDRRPVDEDSVGQHPGVVEAAFGERDTFVEAEDLAFL